MIFLLIKWTISYHQSFHINQVMGTHDFPFHFGFNSGGRYKINVTKGGDSDLLFLIDTEKDIELFKDQNNKKNLCNFTFPINYINLMHVEKGIGFLTGQIDKKGIYYTTITICQQKQGYSILLTYTNPNSVLSYEEQPCFFIELFFTSFMFVIFTFWIVNWSKYFSFKNILHTFVTACLLLTIIYDRFLSYNSSDNRTNDRSFAWFVRFPDVSAFFNIEKVRFSEVT